MILLARGAGSTEHSLRSADFPRTFIDTIHLDLTSPHHWVTLTWKGPAADRHEQGPFHSSPGKGLGDNDCDDVAESNRYGSNCTPKGTTLVEGFSKTLPSTPSGRYVTWISRIRAVGFHSSSNLPGYPASQGCVRLDAHAAQLIYDNSVVGQTKIIVDGTWTPPPGLEPPQTEPSEVVKKKEDSESDVDAAGYGL